MNNQGMDQFDADQRSRTCEVVPSTFIRSTRNKRLEKILHQTRCVYFSFKVLRLSKFNSRAFNAGLTVIKLSAQKKMIVSVGILIFDLLYEKPLLDRVEKYAMSMCRLQSELFQTFEYEVYTTDVP